MEHQEALPTGSAIVSGKKNSSYKEENIPVNTNLAQTAVCADVQPEASSACVPVTSHRLKANALEVKPSEEKREKKTSTPLQETSEAPAPLMQQPKFQGDLALSSSITSYVLGALAIVFNIALAPYVLVLGFFIVSFMVFGFVMGIRSVKSARRAGEHAPATGVTAIILSGVQMALAVLFLVLATLVFVFLLGAFT